MNKIKKVLLSIASSGAAMVAYFFIYFFLTPYITETLGVESYGFVTLAANFVTYASIITLALNSYAARYIVVEYHRKNHETANRYFSSVFFGNLVLGGIIFAVGLVFIANMSHLLQIPAALAADVRLLFLLTFFNFCITTAGSVFSVAAYAKNCLYLTGIFRTASYMSEIVLFLLLFGVLKPHIYYVGIMELSAGIIVAVGGVVLTRIKTPDLLLSGKMVSFAMIKQLVLSGLWNALNSLGNVLNSGLDLVVCNLLLSNAAMGELAVTKTMTNAFPGVYQLISQAFQPMLLKTYSEGDTNKLVKELRVAMKLSGLFSCIIFGGFFAFGRAFYQLWVPGQNTELLYRLTVLTAMISITEGAIYPLYYVYTLTVNFKFPSIMTVTGGVLNVVGMFVLIRFFGMGIYAVALTTVVVMTFINGVTNPIYIAKCLGVKWTTFYPTLGQSIVSCAAMTLVFTLVARVICPKSWLVLILAALLCCVLGAIVHYVFALNKGERTAVLAILKQKLHVKTERP